jgi:hypothetical protein
MAAAVVGDAALLLRMFISGVARTAANSRFTGEILSTPNAHRWSINQRDVTISA